MTSRAPTKWFFGDVKSALDNHAWHKNNSGRVTHPVGERGANQWGLYDMYGNVHEWCHDCYDVAYYGRSPTDAPKLEVGPTGSTGGSGHVIRGGSCIHNARVCRSADRGYYVPDIKISTLGFRVCLVPAEQPGE